MGVGLVQALVSEGVVLPCVDWRCPDLDGQRGHCAVYQLGDLGQVTEPQFSHLSDGMPLTFREHEVCLTRCRFNTSIPFSPS